METPTAPRQREQILNVPNTITFARLILFMPLFVLLVLVWHENFWAFIVLVALGATDWIDGFAARKLGQVTHFGAVLDPVADRASQVVVCVTLVISGILPLWILIAIAATDLILGLIILAYKRQGSMTITYISKIRTTFLMLGLPLLLLGHSDFAGHEVVAVVAFYGVVIGCLLHVFVGAQYAAIVIREGRAGRADPRPLGASAAGRPDADAPNRRG
ncbi:CDP-alcohol phosphatidyltransferase family protein [Agreia pratensis]|uniref:CDP-alcohol phosphatidyltransferase family protein n=1 Tax=Agreia pratensis TaxID=150121 RepID=UPI000A1CA8C2|nr:CDP-alcohol phosphatidyltransferase family protein [Agreia pratensis]